MNTAEQGEQGAITVEAPFRITKNGIKFRDNGECLIFPVYTPVETAANVCDVLNATYKHGFSEGATAMSNVGRPKDIPDKPVENDKKIQEALDVAYKYGSMDGGHHKMWVIDQMVRALLETKAAYGKWITEFREGDEGPETYEWDEGIAP